MISASASQVQVKIIYISLTQCVNSYIIMRIICMKHLINLKKFIIKITEMTWIIYIAKIYLDKISGIFMPQ